MIDSIKVILNFCNSAVYFDFNKIGIVIQLNNLRGSIFDIFHETVPKSKILESQSIIEDMILKINENDIENIVDKIYDLREKVIFMIAYKKVKENSYK